ncbi:hypothetical protein HDU80_001252 [Chytriomyces hyalinus]|nr:hypothetical protein HDU80_001252 [Chytriomyces hyalinus]
MLLDEVPMWGQKLLGHTVHRANEAFNDGKFLNLDSEVPLFGGIHAVIAFGDHKQLPPVCDPPLYTTQSNQSNVCNFGRQSYISLAATCFYLDTKIRQNGTTPFLEELTRLREGTVTLPENRLQSQTFWMERHVQFLQDENDKRILQDIHSEGILFATSFNKEKDIHNSNYIRTFANVMQSWQPLSDHMPNLRSMPRLEQ